MIATNWEGIPSSLRPLRAWGFYTSQKLPLTAISVRERYRERRINGVMRLSEPELFETYDGVLSLAREGRLLSMIQGPALCMDEAHGVVCIDLDDPARKVAGRSPAVAEHFIRNASEAQAEIMSAFRGRAFIETSRSGHGTHILVRGRLPHAKYALGVQFDDALAAHTDIFAGNQMLFMTGVRAPGSLDDVPDGQATLDRFHTEFARRGLLQPVAETPPVALSPDLTDECGRSLDLTDGQVLMALYMIGKRSYYVLTQVTRGVPDWSQIYRNIIGDLDKITGDADQIRRIVNTSEFMAATGGETKDGRTRWHKAEKLFDQILSKCRSQNNERWGLLSARDRIVHVEVLKSVSR